jgi:AcrR family transcriptional regulator
MATTPKSARLPTDERRAAILNAVRDVFAERGFHGTTTRQLADAAAVSEALLFKHFPSKEALYAAMQESCWDDVADQEIRRLGELQPSTATLVVLVQFLASRIIGDWAGRTGRGHRPTLISRLMMHSILEDGVFARGFIKRFEGGWLSKFEQCIEAAREAGDLVDSPVPGRLRGWFVHHLVVMILIQWTPGVPVASYGVSREELVPNVVWFALRGIGVKDEAILRYFDPRALALLQR